MKLVMTKFNGDVFETELPRRKSKHRVPQTGSVIEYVHDSGTFVGRVTDVTYKYVQVLGDLRRTEVTVFASQDKLYP